MKCKQCGIDYEAKRATSQYCSAVCRVTAHRLSVTDDAPTLSVTGNPLALPGDPDYVGVCKEVNGEWVVKPDPPAPVASLSDAELQIRMKSYPGASWIGSPEYKEVIRRRTVEAA